MSVVVKRLNLVEPFLVSMKELLIRKSVALHLANKLVSSFVWISYLFLFSIKLPVFARERLWDVLKCSLSLVYDRENTKTSFSSLQNMSWNSFVKASLPENLSFCMLFREFVKSSSRSFPYLQRVLEYWYELENV